MAYDIIVGSTPGIKCNRCLQNMDVISLHDKLCGFYWFRNVRAPEIGWVSLSHLLNDEITVPYLRTIFDLNNIEYRVYHTNIFGSAYEMFVDSNVEHAISMYVNGQRTFGMNVGDYICRIFSE